MALLVTKGSVCYVIVFKHLYSIGRQILTKKAFVYDPTGNSDAEDVVASYKPDEGENDQIISTHKSEFTKSDA